MNQEPKIKNQNNRAGFTLVEILVATTIFVIVAASLLSLFNYILKINRRTEALSQASQGARDFVEFLVKEIRNGQIDYYINDGTTPTYKSPITPSSPCSVPQTTGGNPVPTPTPSTYYSQDNKLGIINTDGVEECFYFGDNNGVYVDAGNAGAPVKFTAPSGSKYTLVLQKNGVTNSLIPNPYVILNPPNFRIDQLMFLIRPLCDPYAPSCKDYGNNYPQIQPSVVIIIRFTVQLPTGETTSIYYQTSVSSNKYDIP